MSIETKKNGQNKQCILHTEPNWIERTENHEFIKNFHVLYNFAISKCTSLFYAFKRRAKKACCSIKGNLCPVLVFNLYTPWPCSFTCVIFFSLLFLLFLGLIISCICKDNTNKIHHSLLSIDYVCMPHCINNSVGS